MYEIIKDLLIGLVSGALSSFIITVCWHNKTTRINEKIEDARLKSQYIKDFSDDIQSLCRYLDRLRLELSFSDSEYKNQIILRLLEARPITSAFKHGMNADGLKVLEDLRKTTLDIEELAKKNTLDKDQCVIHSSKLFKFELDLLKRQTEFRTPWDDYKNHNS